VPKSPGMAMELQGSVLIHAGRQELALALEEVRGHPRSGLVFAGVPDAHARAAFQELGGRVVLDQARWRKAMADPVDLFGFVAEDHGQRSLFPAPTLADYVAAAPEDVAHVLTPTGFIPADRLDLMAMVIHAAASCDDSRTVALIPTDAAVLDGPRASDLLHLLANSPGPVAVVLTGKPQPFGAKNRVAGLRALLSAAPGTMVLASEPAIALDSVLHGAGVASVGVTSVLRKPGSLGDSAGFANGRVSGMFLRDLWEHRSPPTYAEWYEGSREPRCRMCEVRSFASYDCSSRDKAQITRHNVHAWLQVLDEIDKRDLFEARAFLMAERRSGLDRHGVLRPFAPLKEFDQVIRQLVLLDDGTLPASLNGRSRS
jgi:hypothetical protein